MKRIHVKNLIMSIWLLLFLVFSSTSLAVGESQTSSELETADTVDSAVQTETESQADDRREKILQEAVDALSKTREALKALEEERIDDALEALAFTIGKLELIVSRYPELALAPTSVMSTMHDLIASQEDIKNAIASAQKNLRNGNVQEARQILENLRSEVVITVTNLPLATYPDAIKRITPLIDQEKIEEAKQALKVALNTLVLTDHVIPLAVLRSQELLKLAEELAEKSDRTEEENDELSNHLSAVREQLEIAGMLGYGNKNDYKDLYSQLDQIENKIRGGKHGEGLFDEIRTTISNLLSVVSS